MGIDVATSIACIPKQAGVEWGFTCREPPGLQC